MNSLRSAANLVKNLCMARSAYRFFIRDWRSLGDLQRCADAVATMRHSINLEPLPMPGPSARRILVLAPHPDDEILGPGGTLIGAIRGGARVRVVYLTQGKPTQAETLKQEAMAVAQAVGYETRFLDYYARHLPLDSRVIDALRQEMDSFDPQAVMLPFLTDDHDDHRRASHLLCLTHQARGLPAALEVWAYQVYSALLPNVVVDISDVVEDKRRAIAAWRSQAAARDWAHFALGLNAFNSRFLPGSSAPRYAEAFFVLPAPDYCRFCEPYFDADPAFTYYTRDYVRS